MMILVGLYILNMFYALTDRFEIRMGRKVA